jgi:polyisoprenoid-binding protein YceI
MIRLKSFVIFLGFILGLIMLPVSGSAQTPVADMPAGVYKLDETHASLIWKVSHLGLSDYSAQFTKFDAEIDFDPEKPMQSKVTATVDPTSITTHYPYPEKKDFDQKLAMGEDWFNAGEYPKITFKSTEIEQTGQNTGIMRGDLTFLGVTKPMEFDVTFNKAMEKQPFSGRPTLGFSATGTLERSNWGMDHLVPNIGDTVEILLEVEFGLPQNQTGGRI